MMPWLITAYIFFVGCCVGSFLNVCIYRIPNGLSIVRPKSACPACQTPIRWYDNIPIIGYLMLMGRCRSCKAPIAIRYPMVELLTGGFAVALWVRYGLDLQTLVYFIFVAALLVVTFIDIDHRIIPDVISLPGIPIGFVASFALTQPNWTGSLLGIVIGGGSLLSIAWGYQLLTGKDGMGGGDIKLLAMIGAFIGWKGVLFTIMASSFIGTLAGLAAMLKAQKGLKMALPFGPFLAIGAMLYLFFGPQLIEWYLLRLN